MGTGIVVCGLNGVGKSTLGKALAECLNFYFIDIEDLCFPKDSSSYLYASPRTREEVCNLLLQEVTEHENFVLANVKGDYTEKAYPFFRLAILIEVPKNIRIQRVKERSYKKFGKRMLPGGDLYEQEEAFFNLVCSRDESMVEKWVQSLNCPILQIDGTKPIEENISLIVKQIQR